MQISCTSQKKCSTFAVGALIMFIAVISAEKPPENAEKGRKNAFFYEKICTSQKKAVLLSPLSMESTPNGAPNVAMLRWGRAEAQVACPFSDSGMDHRNLVAEREGKLSEWSKEPHSKCGVRITSYRGFESLTFRVKRSGTSYGMPLILFREGQGLLTPRSGALISLRSNDYCLRQLTNPSLSEIATLPRMLLARYKDYAEIPHFPQESSGMTEK